MQHAGNSLRRAAPAKKVGSTCQFHEASFDVTIEAGFRPIETVSRSSSERKETQPCVSLIIVRASRATIPYLLERWLGLNGDTARWIGPVLSQGGEFAFILFAVGVMQSMIGELLVHLLKLVSNYVDGCAISCSFYKTSHLPCLQRQSHLNRIAVGGFEALGGHKELKWRCP